MSWAQLAEEVDRLAAAMANAGVERGDRVAIHMPNLPQTVLAFQATLRLGAVAVMTNPLYTAPEIEHQWNDAGCRMAFTTDFLYKSRLAPIRDRLPVTDFVVASIPEYLRFPLSLLAPLKLRRAEPPLIARVRPERGVHLFRAFLKSAGGPTSAELPAPEDLAALQYTGGTTGVSKGAMLTHANLSANARQVASWIPDLTRGTEVFLTVLPLFHVFGLTVAMNFPLAIAGAMVIVPNPRDIDGIIKGLRKHRVTVFPIVPAILNPLCDHPDLNARCTENLRVCVSGSAPLPEKALRRFEKITGGKIIEGFGLTEASPVTHVNPVDGTRKVNTIGLPLPDTDSRIVAIDTGKEVPAGEEGELHLAGPQVMRGYWNRPEETATALRDGWLCTGDLATMDEEGYHQIVGRKKDMILASGYNIYPDEIDQVLVSHSGVLEAATIGLPDEKRGETVKSFLVRETGSSVTEDEVLSWCRERLAAYKVPRAIEFRDELPKSAVLKILRRELRDEELRKRSGES
jgi:long-chain acyl-CoA synthetase